MIKWRILHYCMTKFSDLKEWILITGSIWPLSACYLVSTHDNVFLNKLRCSLLTSFIFSVNRTFPLAPGVKRSPRLWLRDCLVLSYGHNFSSFCIQGKFRSSRSSMLNMPLSQSFFCNYWIDESWHLVAWETFLEGSLFNPWRCLIISSILFEMSRIEAKDFIPLLLLGLATGDRLFIQSSDF